MLPYIPSFAGLSETDREARAERLMDRADDALLSGRATQAQYDAWVRRLDNAAAAASILPVRAVGQSGTARF